jgi:hypothetical protein
LLNFIDLYCAQLLIVVFNFETVSQQVTAANKKACFGPKVGTTPWWIEKIKSEPGPKYTELWTHYSNYWLRKFKAISELDYKVLGFELTGAPDHPSNLEE